jgi:hypothetical protein
MRSVVPVTLSRSEAARHALLDARRVRDPRGSRNSPASRPTSTCSSTSSSRARPPPRLHGQGVPAAREGDVLKSVKGRNGGFTLARRPSEITLMNIIEAVEGPQPARLVRGRFAQCHDAMPCAQHDLYKPIRQRLRTTCTRRPSRTSRRRSSRRRAGNKPSLRPRSSSRRVRDFLRTWAQSHRKATAADSLAPLGRREPAPHRVLRAHARLHELQQVVRPARLRPTPDIPNPPNGCRPTSAR